MTTTAPSRWPVPRWLARPHVLAWLAEHTNADHLAIIAGDPAHPADFRAAATARLAELGV